MMFDQINASFELVGALCRAYDCMCLLEDRCYRGGSILSAMFFFMWGLFNTMYYPHLDQHWSFWAAVALAAMNGLWIVMALRFRRG